MKQFTTEITESAEGKWTKTKPGILLLAFLSFSAFSAISVVRSFSRNEEMSNAF